MALSEPGPIAGRPLRLEERPEPVPEDHEVLVRVERCGVCRTDLHVVTGDLPVIRRNVVPGHEVVGTIVQTGAAVRTLTVGQRVGIPWLRKTCGRCEYCLAGRENLCESKEFTGYTADGGYAELALGEEGYVLPLPTGDPAPLAPLLCAGIIGYRAFKLARPGPGHRIGFFGFGGSAHLTLQLAARLGFETVAYSRAPAHLALAERLGATETVLTSGPRPDRPPSLDAALVFAPVGDVVLEALRELRKGGTVAIAAIHLSPIPSIDYDRWLFGERRIVSVEANTRADAFEFLTLAQRLALQSEVRVRPLAEANDALHDLEEGRVTGAAVLDCTAR
jgi:alcohol dehydrogenase, propanol-preferring